MDIITLRCHQFSNLAYLWKVDVAELVSNNSKTEKYLLRTSN